MQFGNEQTNYCELICSSYCRSNITHSIEKTRKTTKIFEICGSGKKPNILWGSFPVSQTPRQISKKAHKFKNWALFQFPPSNSILKILFNVAIMH